jgi:hypothetical protein
MPARVTMSLWESEAAMRSYENGEILKKTILPQLTPFFSGDYTTTRREVRLAEEFLTSSPESWQEWR